MMELCGSTFCTLCLTYALMSLWLDAMVLQHRLLAMGTSIDVIG